MSSKSHKPNLSHSNKNFSSIHTSRITHLKYPFNN